MSKHLVRLKINGQEHNIETDSNRLLSELIRDDLFLTGTKRGCETGVCGACSVLVDGIAIKSCLSISVQWNGCEIKTIEGVSDEGELHPVQQAFIDHGGFQCGYCTPGMIISACALLEKNPNPTREEVRHGLSGNLCRCTGYMGIVDSVMSAAEKMRER